MERLEIFREGYSSLTSVNHFLNFALNPNEQCVAHFDINLDDLSVRSTLDIPELDLSGQTLFGVNKEGLAYLVDSCEERIQELMWTTTKRKTGERSGYIHNFEILHMVTKAAKGEMVLRKESSDTSVSIVVSGSDSPLLQELLYFFRKRD